MRSPVFRVSYAGHIVGWIPDELNPEDDHHREVYASYGLAMYCAQVLEHELANFVVVSRWDAGTLASHEEREELWQTLFASTMGQQIHHALSEARLSREQTQLLEDALASRNFLAHDYFRDRIRKLSTERGRDDMIEELDGLRAAFIAADAALSPLALEIMSRCGVTRERIQTEVARLREEALVSDLLYQAVLAEFDKSTE